MTDLQLSSIAFLKEVFFHCIYNCCMVLFWAAVSWLLQYAHCWNYLLKLWPAPEKILLFKMALASRFQPQFCAGHTTVEIWESVHALESLFSICRCLTLKEEMGNGDLAFFIQYELARPVSEILNRCEIAVRLEQSGRNAENLIKKKKIKLCQSTLSSRARRRTSGMKGKNEFQLLLLSLPQILVYLYSLYTYISLLC